MSLISRQIERMVQSMTRETAYLKHYICKVQSQSGQTVDLMPDDPDMRGDGLTGIPISNGLPGVEVKVAPGSDAILFYEDGDPTKPKAKIVSADHISITFAGGTMPVARVNDTTTVSGTITGKADLTTGVVTGTFSGTGTIVAGAPTVKA